MAFLCNLLTFDKLASSPLLLNFRVMQNPQKEEAPTSTAVDSAAGEGNGTLYVRCRAASCCFSGHTGLFCSVLLLIIITLVHCFLPLCSTFSPCADPFPEEALATEEAESGDNSDQDMPGSNVRMDFPLYFLVVVFCLSYCKFLTHRLHSMYSSFPHPYLLTFVAGPYARCCPDASGRSR